MAATKKDQSGSNNPSWKGGISKNLTKYKKLYNQRHPEATKANKAVYEALKSGKLKKEPCESCGIEVGVHAHHDDYSKLLEVVWLCPPCHRMRHGLSR